MEEVKVTPKNIKKFGFSHRLLVEDGQFSFCWQGPDGKQYPSFTLAVLALNRRYCKVRLYPWGYTDGHSREAVRRILYPTKLKEVVEAFLNKKASFADLREAVG